MKGSHLIEVENLKVFYKFTSKGLKKEHRLVQAVNDVASLWKRTRPSAS